MATMCFTHLLVHPLTLDTTLKACGNTTTTQCQGGPTRPTEPSLTLLLDTLPFTVPSELAKTGIGPQVARLPTHLTPRGVLLAAIPPPRCRARYRWVINEGRKATRHHLQTPPK
ncbi:E4 [Cervus elaphus papillomavirus 1]|uniref:E4 n=1 Tax=Cervus elaphus papillomavirus 1 TaxID=1163699 RepID=I3RWJ8_9PAPI|nr:E4 [Cervus elaphus papillomavirus 1]QIQ60728.1 E4 [Cervus elaphus papillomavirus 1]QIQ60737.1 E4 [Cervus elaphus papillomavirus 1]QNR09197.1 E4 [Cervus elaphus papillomavirus 1]